MRLALPPRHRLLLEATDYLELALALLADPPDRDAERTDIDRLLDVIYAALVIERSVPTTPERDRSEW